MASRATKVLLALSMILLLPPAAATADHKESPSLNGVLGITHGAHIRPVYLPGTPDWGYGDEILAFDDLVGKDIGVVMYFANWLDAGGHALDPFLLNLIQSEISDPSRRPVIMLTWEPTRTAAAASAAPRATQGPSRRKTSSTAIAMPTWFNSPPISKRGRSVSCCASPTR